MKTKLVASVAALLLLAVFSSFFLLPSARPTPPSSVTVISAANLRAGPGTNFAKVGSAQPQQTLTIVGCNEACDWYQLDTGEWIAAFLVEPVADMPALTEQDEQAPPVAESGEREQDLPTLGSPIALDLDEVDAYRKGHQEFRQGCRGRTRTTPHSIWLGDSLRPPSTSTTKRSRTTTELSNWT